MTPQTHTPSVLITDDEPGLRLALQANFLRHGWRAETASGLAEALAWLERSAFDLVLCDVRMGDGNGFAVMRAVRDAHAKTAFLFLTAYASVPEAVQAMQGGAVDYLTKPIAFDQLLSVATRILDGRKGPPPPASGEKPGGMVGRSRGLGAALARAQAAAEGDADVLIEAESGTGKELLARMIHDNSARRGRPFIAINCAALPEALLESELFGHARGAFTGAVAAKAGKFEMAHGGTLLLDEIGDMPLNLQPKLLRVLQERVVERLGETRSIRTDIRVIASTNLQLGNRVDRGLFRSDLFYRLNVIPLTLPPLRDRMEDLPPLAQHFAQMFAQKSGGAPVPLHPSFLRRLETYHWPGNIRELANFMQRVLSLSPEAELTSEAFDREHQPHGAPRFPVPAQRFAGEASRALSSAQPFPAPAHSFPSPAQDLVEGRGGMHTLFEMPLKTQRTTSDPTHSMGQVERTHLERTLELVGGNRTRAAEMLGISVRTMRNKIRQYDLPPRRYA